MKIRHIAISATALMLTMGGAMAQSTDAGAAGGGYLCSAFGKLDAAAQTAFVQGYRAGRQDAMMSGMGATAGGSTDTATTSTAAAGSGTDTTTTTTTTATDTAAATTTTADAATTTTTADSGAGAGATVSTGADEGSDDLAAIVAGCAETPTGSIWQFMEAHGGSDPVASQQN